MKVMIVRRVRGATPSMDIYADNLVAGLRSVRPEWTITELEPKPWNSPDKLWLKGPGFRKYYECFWRYPREVSQHQADIFHIIDGTDGHIARWLRNSGKLTVVTCHDLVQFVYPDSLIGESRFPAFSLAVWQQSVRGMCQANHIISVSSNTAKDVQKFLPITPENISVVLNGIDPQFRILPKDSSANFRQKYAVSPETLCLLNVGATSPRKNILTVLKVLATLSMKGISASLWKVGGEFKDEHKDFIEKHNLQQKIIHFIKPDKDTLEQIYNAADMLLAPSLYEGFGLTILEAMACGLPVVTSNTSSLPEVAGDAACLVNPTDVEEIVMKVCQIKQNADHRSQLIEKGLERVKQFSWKNTSEQVAKVYEELVSNK
ncbi:glycosyltransferase family 4 protein [Nostoc sp. FACHB-152]|uniref:glycosyltransferase family 4 protein n=1 Tax=unclassified Nostoc TaxID=2593658 RepID=UPI001681FD97|nr:MULTISPECIES: glycosyltransferase family 1 protein [unclassified Nostoc]MBD2445785.1 glycosyltransferase family 4 protein [Nostoc sp. FACHB-152]MBD2466899.1 glycosyltransferase family 4 protein [Nostoc sp. FACHB-145]